MSNFNKLYIAFFFVLMIVGLGSCVSENVEPTTSTTNSGSQENAEESAAEERNPFESVVFPQTSCSDSLPTNQSDYPVQIHTVYVDYSEETLQKVQSELCGDAEINQDNTRIKVASYLNREEANQFQEFIASTFDSALVGQPITVERNIETFTISTILSLKCGDTDSVNGISVYSECPEDTDRDSKPDYNQFIIFFENKTAQTRSITFRGVMYASPKTKFYDRGNPASGIRGTLPPKYHEYPYFYSYTTSLYDNHEEGQSTKSFSRAEVGNYSTITLNPGDIFGVRKSLESEFPNFFGGSSSSGTDREFQFMIGGGALDIAEFSVSEQMSGNITCPKKNKINTSTGFGVEITQICAAARDNENEAPATIISYDNQAAENRGVVLKVNNDGLQWTYIHFLPDENSRLSAYQPSYRVIDRDDFSFDYTVFIP